MKSKYKILNKLILFIIFSLLVGCSKDPFEGITSNERTIESFLINGQIGVPVIESQTPNETIATVFVKKGAVNLASVTPVIQTSYKSTISPASGETVNFSNADSTAVFSVKAESGQVRTWKIKVKEYDFDMEGVWKVSKMYYSYHVAPSESWGWTGTKEFEWYMSGAWLAKDDSFEFKLEGVTQDGKIYGTFVHNLGADGKAVNFTYTAATPNIDLNYKFNKVPAINGTWTRDFGTNTITFNAGQAGATQSLPIEFQNNKNVLILPFNPGPSDFPGGNDWNLGEIQYSNKFWYQLEKF